MNRNNPPEVLPPGINTGCTGLKAQFRGAPGLGGTLASRPKKRAMAWRRISLSREKPPGFHLLPGVSPGYTRNIRSSRR